MTSEDIRSRIRDFIYREFPLASPKTVNDDTSLMEEGIIDSIGVLDIISFLESEFAITISDDDIVPEDFASVRALADLVEHRMASEPSK